MTIPPSHPLIKIEVQGKERYVGTDPNRTNPLFRSSVPDVYRTTSSIDVPLNLFLKVGRNLSVDPQLLT